jgi:hypothetical protein
VADRGEGRILQILEGGEALQPPRVIADTLEGPEGVVVDEGGRMLVVEADAGRVSSIDLETGRRSVLAKDLELHVGGQPGFPSTMFFNGIAVGNGRIFVTGDKASLIYVVE